MGKWILTAFIAMVLLIAGGTGLVLSGVLTHPTIHDFLTGTGWTLRPKRVTVEHIDYHPPKLEELLTDDRIEDKIPLPFDPTLVDRRPIGDEDEWLLNSSTALLRLDVPLIKPDQEGHLLTLYPSYADAVTSAANQGTLLLSVNLLDGKAKQFDDGLYAALDLAYYQGFQERLTSHVALIHRIYDRAGKDNPAAPFLAAGLELAGVKVDVSDQAEKDRWLASYRARPLACKPIGFYTWNEALETCFRVLRFYQNEFPPDDLTVPAALVKVLAGDPELLAEYKKAIDFFARLTNPYSCLSLADVVDAEPLTSEELLKRCATKKTAHEAISFFPPSTSRETELFQKLFPLGLPAEADLMRELVRGIRSGSVSLQPRPDSGWYDYQVHALETLLLPERGEEKHKLLLTKAYKERMLEAFKALITKRRETHARQFSAVPTSAAMPRLPDQIKPRLRVEPCPSYYLRTARAYAFLANFLEASVGIEALESLHGLRKDGPRELSLHAELRLMRELFYGLYLVSAEDIGLKPTFHAEENVDVEKCYALATSWLPRALEDRDLATDTRVSIPIVSDPQRKVTRLWMTLGVRLAKLDVSYARPPHLKPVSGGEWTPVESHRLAAASYLIPVDEFAEVEMHGSTALNREELRAVCDREKTKEAIVAALRKR